MLKAVMPALVAGLLGAATMLGAPAPASAGEVSAQTVFASLKQSGAAIDFAQFRGKRGGFGRGGLGRGRGFGGGGFGRRGFGGRGYGRGYGYGGGYGYRRGGVGAGAVLGGLAAGALIGGAIASQAAPAPAGDAVAYCTQRFRSYDPASGTYLGNDGARHACP